MTITWPMFLWGFGILGAWTTFLLGIIKFLMTRQLTAFIAKQAETDKKATEANIKAADAHIELANQKQAFARELAAMKFEFSQKSICGNHQRMEANDKDLFVRLDSLHGDIRELVGGVKGLTNSLELINQHLLNGGK